MHPAVANHGLCAAFISEILKGHMREDKMPSHCIAGKEKSQGLKLSSAAGGGDGVPQTSPPPQARQQPPTSWCSFPRIHFFHLSIIFLRL